MARRVPVSLVVLISSAAIVLGAAAGHLASGSLPALALVFPLLLVPVLVWRNPRSGLYLVFAATLTVEQFGYAVGPREGAVTSRIPFFHGVLPAGVSPAEILLVLTVTVVVMQAVQRRQPLIHRSPLLTAMVVLLALVLFFLVVGLGKGGEPKMALWEVRPYAYLFLAYFLAAALISDFAHVRPLLWLIVLGTGSKAIYGIVIFYSVRNLDPRPEAVLAHEESLFFGIFVIATLAMWFFRFRDPVRVVATALLPVVLLADMVNSRRTAWLILFSGIAVLAFVALVRLKEHRRTTATVIAVSMVGGLVYLGAFWGQDGTVAQPARAVRSVVAPSDRDKDSNHYRDIEDYNLRLFVSQSHSLGMGYGQKLTYVGLVDLTKESPILAYVPHNNVMWVWVRMGLAGIVAFSLMLAQAMITAARLTASRRRELAMVGAVVAAALVGYVAMGAKDMGFFWFRNALAMGLLLGAAEGLLRADRRRELEATSSGQDPATALKEPGSASMGVAVT